MRYIWYKLYGGETQRKRPPNPLCPPRGECSLNALPSDKKVPRVIRFRFMGLPEREIMGLVTIFPMGDEDHSRVLVTVEGNRLFPRGKYSIEVSGEGLLLPVTFDADDGGVGGTTKAADVQVPANFKPKLSVGGPGF